MRVNFRTLDRRELALEVGQADTVADLKTRLEDQLGRSDLFRLIYCGRLLRDDELVAKYKIEEKRCVVVMVTKGREERGVEENLVNEKRVKEKKIWKYSACRSAKPNFFKGD